MTFDQKLSELANKLAKDFMDYFKHAYGTPDVPGRLSELVDWRHLANNKFDQLMTWMRAAKTQISQLGQRYSEVHQKLEEYDQRYDDMDSHFGLKLDDVNVQIENLHITTKNHTNTLDTHSSRFTRLENRLNKAIDDWALKLAELTPDHPEKKIGRASCRERV